MYQQLYHQDAVQRLLLVTKETVLPFIYLFYAFHFVLSCNLSSFLINE